MSDEKKIIVDEDWKSRVAAEKEELQREASSHGDQAQAAAPTEPSQEGSPQWPAASFETLVTTLATEAMIGMGQLPHPLSGKIETNVAEARYGIDMLEMLAEKTKGNLTPDEDRGLRELLHQLRMAFVATQAGGSA